MAENSNPGEKKLSVSSKTLTLKRSAETGVVRQSFSHGRTKSVVVEKVKRRVIGTAPEPKAEAPAGPAPAPAAMSSIVRSAKPQRRASVRRTSGGATMKKPSAGPTRWRKSALAV